MNKLLSFALLITTVFAKSYDYIVAGAGSSGCIVAERLSRDPRNKVLVLDSGEDYSDTILTTPSLYKSLSPPPIDHLELVEQVLTYEYPEAPSVKSFITKYALGGASAMNGNFIQRVPAVDLNMWAQITNSPVWTFNNTFNDYKNVEKWNSSDPTNQHGKTGPITMQTFEERKIPLYDLIVASLATATSSPILSDSNLGNVEGVSYGARSIAAGPDPLGEGVRQDTYTRFLKPYLPARPNLTLRSGCKVTNIEFKIKNNKPPSVKKVNFVCKGVSDDADVNNEVVLATGIFNTPQLLMLSGIGPAAQLISRGIPVVFNNSHVGKHLQGNVGNLLVYVYPGASYGLPPLNLPNGIIVTNSYKSDPSQPRADLEISINCFRQDQYPILPGDACNPLVIQNIINTEGTVNLRNNNPLDQVNVTYGFFKNPFNLLPMVKGFKQARSTFASLPVPFFEVIPGYDKVPATATDAEILQYIMTGSQAEWHDVGTARMSATPDTGVVDARLRVWGVDGLRVADQSVVPIPYSGHSAASGAILIGSVAGRLILEDNM